MNLKGRFLSIFAKIVEKIFPDETISSSKKKWNKLAEENARYYILSKEGYDITEEKFHTIGKESYIETVRSDEELHRLEPLKQKKALEIGCGIGRYLSFFSEDFQEVTGLDISDQMIEEGRERLKHLPNVRLVVGDGVHYPFPDNSFDVVFSYLVFQHMPTRVVVEENLKEVYRVLSPTGIAKIQLRGGATPFKWSWFYGPSYSKEEGVAVVEKLGFTVIKTADDQKKRFWLWLKK